MNPSSSKKITVLAIASMFGLGMAKSLLADQQFPQFRFFAASGFAAFLLSAASDVEPDLAGPFSLLILTVVSLEEGPPILKALNSNKAGAKLPASVPSSDSSAAFDSSVTPVTTTPPGYADLFANAKPLTMTPPKIRHKATPKLPDDPYAARRIFAHPPRRRTS